jgi:hypothetical protein
MGWDDLVRANCMRILCAARTLIESDRLNNFIGLDFGTLLRASVDDTEAG